MPTTRLSVHQAAGFLGALTLAATTTGQDSSAVRFDRQEGKVIVRIAGRPMATYVLDDKTITRPYFAHLHAPGGVQVTRNHPPREGDAKDHATMHPGLWLAFGDVSGNDDWRLRAKVVHDGFVEEPSAEKGRGRFAVRNRYLSADGKATVCTEVCRYTFHVRAAGYLLLWDSTFSSDAGDFSFGDQEEMGLGVRVATPIAVSSSKGGRILDSQGRRNGKGVWGKQAAWCDYSGPVGGGIVGVTIMPDPANFRSSWWHARDYGLLVANPFGRQALSRGEKSKVFVKRGETFRLRFGVLLHSHNVAERPELVAAYQDFLRLIDPSAETTKYVRPSGKGYVPETEIRIQTFKGGYRVTSRTQRGELRLEVTSRFDDKHRLLEASVFTEKGGEKQIATVTVSGEKAKVARPGKEPVTLKCPPGVIVTSAPDWTDAFLAVRRFDPAAAAKQEFTGLWVHPTRDPLQPTFKLTRLGENTVTQDGKRVRLLRLRVELRGGSRYLAWRNDGGQLVRLIPEGKPRQGIILTGWEKATNGLR